MSVTDIYILSVTAGSLVYYVQIIGYSTQSNALQGALVLDNIIFPNGLGDNTITSNVLPPTVPTSNICFPAGTPIKTDQGLVSIELLDPSKHTINKKMIHYVTQTITLDPYLICFEPHSLGFNSPTNKTIMTKDHNIEYDGKMVPACRFLKLSQGVYKVKYNKEILYNVLLADYGKMRVNNLICETLHPDNMIAKLYTNNYSNAEKNAIIFQMNESLETKNFTSYKNVISKLNNKK